MAFDNSLLTSFLNDCNIKYQVEDGLVSFEYDQRFFFGTISSLAPFDSCLSMILPGLCEVSPFDAKTYLKFINKLNDEMDLVKFVLNERNNSIYVEASIPLDSSPELDDLVPGLVKVLLAAHDKFSAAHQ
ncbi:MAG: hypothetical protein J6T96_06070 [Bacteroidales bacterium]|nr:hypothetical protein [Bacteroidales bacterium]